MAWAIPKTDWAPGDRFNVTDYNRIKNNLAYLHDLGTELYPSFSIEDMGADKDVTGHYFASEFNVLENNLNAINSGTYPRDYGGGQTFADNGPFIGYAELNRLEAAVLGIYNTLTSQKDGVNKLAITLGIKTIGGI